MSGRIHELSTLVFVDTFVTNPIVLFAEDSFVWAAKFGDLIWYKKSSSESCHEEIE